MNSRSAKNATTANSAVATPSPDAQPTQNTITIAQEVRSRARVSVRRALMTSACGESPRSRSDSMNTVTWVRNNSPKTMMNSALTCCSAVRLRRYWFMAQP